MSPWNAPGRRHPLTQSIPVIVLTGANHPALKRQLMSLGVAEYLAKPLVFDDLHALLKRNLPAASSSGDTTGAAGRLLTSSG